MKNYYCVSSGEKKFFKKVPQKMKIAAGNAR